MMNKFDRKSWTDILATSLLTAALCILWQHTAQAKDKAAEIAIPAPQLIRLATGAQQYDFALYANMPLQTDSEQARTAAAKITRVIVLQHGVKRNGDQYYATGIQFLEQAQLDPVHNLLLAPTFLTAKDALAKDSLPLWAKGSWMQGRDSSSGRKGISSLRVFDDIASFVSDGRFPALREIVFIGHSAGAQLLQRYAVLNNSDERLRQAGINVRYVISSPSSYLYLDPSRLGQQGFAPVTDAACPDYDKYRYGLTAMIPYGRDRNGQVNGEQLFKRYAARDVTYLVGTKDNDPHHRYLDQACGAQMQGANRLERQHHYLQYEQFLAQKWATPLQRVVFEVPGVGHNAERLLTSDIAIAHIFPPLHQ